MWHPQIQPMFSLFLLRVTPPATEVQLSVGKTSSVPAHSSAGSCREYFSATSHYWNQELLQNTQILNPASVKNAAGFFPTHCHDLCSLFQLKVLRCLKFLCSNVKWKDQEKHILIFELFKSIKASQFWHLNQFDKDIPQKSFGSELWDPHNNTDQEEIKQNPRDKAQQKSSGPK